MAFKPDGYTSVSPYLIVRDANKTLAFVEAVFGAVRLRVIPREDGVGIMHAEARIDDSVIMMGEQPDGPDTNVHVYVSDVEAAFERAEEAGGTIVQELKRQGDGDYRGGIADGNGVIWWLSQQDV
ncbi:MAG: VOC family protein [Pseudomonadota bacterium]